MAVLAELVLNHWVAEKDALAALALAVPLNGRPWKRPLRPDVVRRQAMREARSKKLKVITPYGTMLHKLTCRE